MIRLTALLVLGLMNLPACSGTDQTSRPADSIPEPSLVNNYQFPNTETTYYIVWDHFEMDKPSSEGRMLLHDVLDLGIQVKDAWFPSEQTPCMAPGAITVAVVILKNPDDSILDLGAVRDPEGWWIMNCGVSNLWHYDFD